MYRLHSNFILQAVLTLIMLIKKSPCFKVNVHFIISHYTSLNQVQSNYVNKDNCLNEKAVLLKSQGDKYFATNIRRVSKHTCTSISTFHLEQKWFSQIWSSSFTEGIANETDNLRMITTDVTLSE